MLLPVQNKKVEMRNKKFSRGIALVFVVLIMGLLAGSLSAAAIEEEMRKSPEELSIFMLSGNTIPLTVDYPSDTIPPIAIEYLPIDTTLPTVIEHTPTGENVPVTTEITITFSEPMNKESAENAFSIYPEVSGKFYWEENTMIFMPSSNLNYDTKYVVELEGAMDSAGNSLSWYEWEFTTGPPNNPPNVPNRPSGQNSGYIRTSYSYSTSAEDPDEDKIKYTFDWGDFTTSATEFVDSGETASLSHDWAKPGDYRIRVKATDDKGASSRWSELRIARILAPIPALSISIFTNPVPSGESDEIKVQVFSDGNPVAGANVYLSSTIGTLYPTRGETDDDGVFVSTYTAPLVSTTQRYTISATAEKEGYEEGINTVSDSIFIETIPALSVSISTNPQSAVSTQLKGRLMMMVNLFRLIPHHSCLPLKGILFLPLRKKKDTRREKILSRI
jgi:hypothetical protein